MNGSDCSGMPPELLAKLKSVARRIGVGELAARIPVHRATLSRLIHGHVIRPSLPTMECIERAIDDMELDEEQSGHR
jgi:hypothetical protein